MALLREWLRIIVRLGVAAALLAGAYVGVAWWTGQHLPTSATVGGIPIGGLSVDQARERLRRDLGPRASAPIRIDVVATGASQAHDPAGLGLSLDVDGALSGLVGFTLDPGTVWERLSGRVDRPVVTKVDPRLLTEAISGLARSVDRATVEGAVTLAGGQPRVTEPQTGLRLASDELVATIVSQWPRTTSFSAPVRVTEPKVGRPALDAVLRDFVTPALSGPIDVVVGNATTSLTPAQFTPAVAVVADSSGALVGQVDAALLTQVLARAGAAVEVAPIEASVVLEGGVPVVRPSVDGLTVDAGRAVSSFRTALTDPARTLVLPLNPVPAHVSTQAAQAWGVTQVVATVDLPVTTDAAGTANLALAAAAVNGAVVSPGASFSLNGVLGERTAAKGYRPAAAIGVTDRTHLVTGAGVEPLATAVHRLAWFAGAQLTNHQAPPAPLGPGVGVDATLGWPGPDLQWTNTTPHAMLVQAWVADGVLHARLWSTKVYDVEAVEGPTTNPRPTATVTDDRPGCLPRAAVPGFDVTVQRILRQAGHVVATESVTTHYQGAAGVLCR